MVSLMERCTDINILDTKLLEALIIGRLYESDNPELREGKCVNDIKGLFRQSVYTVGEDEQFPPVKTKADMVRRYQLGEFGNHSPSWNTFEEFEKFAKLKYPTGAEAHGTSDKYHLRNRVAGGPTHYNLSPYYAYSQWYQYVRNGTVNQWYCSAMAPLHLLNGELMRTHEGLYLYYSTVQKPMRDSLREGGREAKGVAVQLILKHFMNQRSYDWTMMLIDRYPNHVVEFTVVDRCWGTVLGYNTLFWEVRMY